MLKYTSLGFINKKYIILIAFIISLGYFLQTFTPFRIDGDAFTYLSLSHSLVEGNGLLMNGDDTRYPPGYPIFLAFLEYAGILSSRTIVFINIFFLIIGLIFIYVIERGRYNYSNSILTILIITPLSFVLIKNSTQPLSDIPYFGISSMCLFAIFYRDSTNDLNKSLCNVFAVASLLIAISVKTIGICLIPAVIYVYVKRYFKKLISRKNKGHITLVILSIAVILLTSIITIIRTIYFQEAIQRYFEKLSLIEVFSMKLFDLGEVFMNLPTSKLQLVFYDRITAFLAILTGSAVFVMISVHFTKLKVITSVDIYIISYIFTVIIWPYGGPRFWLPLIPILLIRIYSETIRIIGTKKASCIQAAYLLYFSIIGVLALGYSSWVSLSGYKFPERYGNNITKHTYRAAFYSNKPINYEKVDQKHVEIIRRYEKRIKDYKSKMLHNE